MHSFGLEISSRGFFVDSFTVIWTRELLSRSFYQPLNTKSDSINLFTWLFQQLRFACGTPGTAIRHYYVHKQTAHRGGFSLNPAAARCPLSADPYKVWASCRSRLPVYKNKRMSGYSCPQSFQRGSCFVQTGLTGIR